MGWSTSKFSLNSGKHVKEKFYIFTFRSQYNTAFSQFFDNTISIFKQQFKANTHYLTIPISHIFHRTTLKITRFVAWVTKFSKNRHLFSLSKCSGVVRYCCAGCLWTTILCNLCFPTCCSINSVTAEAREAIYWKKEKAFYND